MSVVGPGLQHPPSPDGRRSAAAGAYQDAVLDSLDERICVLDAHGDLLWVNRAWREFSDSNGGSREHTCEGSNYLEACRAPEANAFATGLREVLAGQRTRSELEYTCHSPFERRWYMARALALRDACPARAIVIHLAMSVQKRSELQMRPNATFEVLGALAAGVAHDFNNLLTVLDGRLRLILGHGLLDPAMRTHAHTAHQATRRAIDLVSQILSVARGKSRRRVPMRLGPVVGEAVDLFRFIAPADVEVRCLIDEGLPSASADATEIMQIVLNLCRNGADALCGDPGVVQVELRQSRPDGQAQAHLGDGVGSLELVVSDTGMGFDAGVGERIFDPLFTTKAASLGSGLGLGIVRSIVIEAGWRIDVQSDVAQGSRFRVCIPTSAECLAEGETDHPEAAAGDASRPGKRPDSAFQEKPAGAAVLVVDDDEVVGATIEAYLVLAGWVVRRFVEPAEVLARLQGMEQSYAFALVDHNMPGLNGLDLARELTSHQTGLPVLLMSGYVDAELESRAQHICTAVIRKERLFEDLGSLVVAYGMAAGPRGA